MRRRPEGQVRHSDRQQDKGPRQLMQMNQLTARVGRLAALRACWVTPPLRSGVL